MAFAKCEPVGCCCGENTGVDIVELQIDSEVEGATVAVVKQEGAECNLLLTDKDSVKAVPCEGAQCNPLPAVKDITSCDGDAGQRIVGADSDAEMIEDFATKSSVANATSLADPTLLRGAPIAHVMKCCGTIFENNAGSAETYNLSQVVDSIDWFLSHNWSVPRFTKFFTFALHSERWWALAGSFTWALAMVVLSVQVHLPIYANGQHEHFGILCTVCGPLLFLILLCFGRHFFLFIGYGGPKIFLDKVCIHQTDKEIQRRGIESLGAFVSNSKKLVVIFAESYLQKLWTMYELAIFVSLRSINDIILCPPYIMKLILGGFLTMYSIYLLTALGLFMCGLLDGIPSVLAVKKFLCYSAFSVAASWGCRHWVRLYASMTASIQDFRAQDANCFCEDDRPLVNGIIVAIMKELHCCPHDSDDQVALNAFDELVHGSIPLLITEQCRQGVRYTYVLIVILPEFMFNCDKLCAISHEDDDARKVIGHTLVVLMNFLAISPLGAALLMRISHFQLHWDGWKEKLYLFWLALFCLVFKYLMDFAIVAMSKFAEQSWAGLGMVAVLFIVLLCLTCFCFRSATLPEPIKRSMRSISGRF